MADHIRWGILGAAQFALDHMGPALHAARGGSLAALATSSAEKAAPFQAFAPDLRVFDSYDALLADPGIDAVYIPLPNAMHVPWSIKAAEAGKHVLCEKPVAMSAAELDTLIAARDRTGRLVAEAWMVAHHPQYAKARALIEAGEVGRLLRISSTLTFYNDDLDNIRNRPETGGGALGDLGVYAFGAARLLTGQDPQDILGVEIDWQNGVDASAHVMARFPGFVYDGRVSIRGSLWQEVVVQGDKALLRLPAPFNPQVFGEARVELHRDDQSVETWRYPQANQYVLQAEAFNDAARGRADWPLPLEMSRGTQVFVDRVLEAGREGAGR